jgi:hypothetical protein
MAHPKYELLLFDIALVGAEGFELEGHGVGPAENIAVVAFDGNRV